MTVILHTDTALYTVFLVRPREIPTAGFFPFKEEETEVLRGEKVASQAQKWGQSSGYPCFSAGVPKEMHSLWGDAGPRGYRHSGTKVLPRGSQSAAFHRLAQRCIWDRGPAKTVPTAPGCPEDAVATREVNKAMGSN